jgi:cytochrome P450
MTRPEIDPMPPIATGVGLPWNVAVDDPVETLVRVRAELGDTFVVDSGPDRYLFTFSPEGLANFYALPEDHASKGLADWRMLRRKIPDELFDGRRTLPHELFGRDDVATYLDNVDRALDATLGELAEARIVDVFALTRRLGHRVGLASWGGPGTTTGERFEVLTAALDTLDGADAFVHPDAMVAVARSDKAAERAALAVITEQIGIALDELPGNEADHPLFTRIAGAWDGEPSTTGRQGVAHDVALVHIASMSNLFAALGWAVVDLMNHPAEQTRLREGDRARAEQCALESTRLAQRSIMSRYTLAPFDLTVDARTSHRVPAGITVATLLPLTNTTAAPGFDTWDPDRWNKRRPADTSQLAALELVTTFGHGPHTCPAQPFSLATMTRAVIDLFSTFDLAPAWSTPPRPVPAQIGGVARAAEPCPARITRAHFSSRSRDTSTGRLDGGAPGVISGE